MSALDLVPVAFQDACAFVAEHHRHHQPPQGMKFCVGVAVGSELRGVAITGRPVARSYDDGATLEVTRVAVAEGTPDACSMLYAACWRAAKALGYSRLITYTQADESGSSLRAAGWRVIAQRAARHGWTTAARRRESHGTDNVQRTLWEAAA